MPLASLGKWNFGHHLVRDTCKEGLDDGDYWDLSEARVRTHYNGKRLSVQNLGTNFGVKKGRVE